MFQAEDGIRDIGVTGVQTCALPILLNKLVGKEVMETGIISERLKRGKHTTRHSELVEVNNGFVVDTPGFSTLDLKFDSKEELKDYFREFNEYEDQCKFNGCLHHKDRKSV